MSVRVIDYLARRTCLLRMLLENPMSSSYLHKSPFRYRYDDRQSFILLISLFNSDTICMIYEYSFLIHSDM